MRQNLLLVSPKIPSGPMSGDYEAQTEELQKAFMAVGFQVEIFDYDQADWKSMLPVYSADGLTPKLGQILSKSLQNGYVPVFNLLPAGEWYPFRVISDYLSGVTRGEVYAVTYTRMLEHLAKWGDAMTCRCFALRENLLEALREGPEMA